MAILSSKRHEKALGVLLNVSLDCPRDRDHLCHGCPWRAVHDRQRVCEGPRIGRHQWPRWLPMLSLALFEVQASVRVWFIADERWTAE